MYATFHTKLFTVCLQSNFPSTVITSLHGMQTRSSDKNSVHPSVCRTLDLWQMKESCPRILILHQRTSILVLWQQEWLVGATTTNWNFGSTGPHWSKVADFELTFARSASTLTPSEKSSINTNRKFTTRFPMSLRWSAYVATKSPQKGVKNAKRPFSV